MSTTENKATNIDIRSFDKTGRCYRSEMYLVCSEEQVGIHIWAHIRNIKEVLAREFGTELVRTEINFKGGL